MSIPKHVRRKPDTINLRSTKERNTLGPRPVKRAPGGPTRVLWPTLDGVRGEGFEAYPGSTDVPRKYREAVPKDELDSGAESKEGRDPGTMSYKKAIPPPFGLYEKEAGSSNTRYHIYKKDASGAESLEVEFNTLGQAIAWLKRVEKRADRNAISSKMGHDELGNPVLILEPNGTPVATYTVVLTVGVHSSKDTRSAKMNVIDKIRRERDKQREESKIKKVKTIAYDVGDIELKRTYEEEEREARKSDIQKTLERMKARITQEQERMREQKKTGPERERQEKFLWGLKKRYNQLLQREGKEPYYSVPEGARVTSEIASMTAKELFKGDPGPVLALANEHLDHMIIEYFLTFPNPHDFEIHELAEACGLTHEALEKEIYRLFAQCLRKGIV